VVIAKLKPAKPEANRVMGIDASTKALAFAIIHHDTPIVYGEIDIRGNDTHERCGDVNRKTYALLKQYGPDFIAIEEAIFVNNRSVVIDLAKVYGSIIGVSMAIGIPCVAVHPSSWMAFIDNPTRNSKEIKDAVRKEYPGKSKTWYKNKLREWRKARTQEWVSKNLGIDTDNDDVADATAIASYAYNELTTRT
jgi:Holliday junction resolvasome RuvABC endonuclease subunit